MRFATLPATTEELATAKSAIIVVAREAKVEAATTVSAVAQQQPTSA